MAAWRSNEREPDAWLLPDQSNNSRRVIMYRIERARIWLARRLLRAALIVDEEFVNLYVEGRTA